MAHVVSLKFDGREDVAAFKAWLMDEHELVAHDLGSSPECTILDIFTDDSFVLTELLDVFEHFIVRVGRTH